MMTDNTEALKIEAEGLMAHLQRQILAAQAAPEPGDKPGTVIDTTELAGDAQAMIPMAVASSAQASAGYTVVYDTETGAPSTINNNMLKHQLLQKKRKTRDGRLVPAFTTIKPDPSTLAKRLYLKCMLHPEHEDHAEFAGYGFQPCWKANLTSHQVVLTHMQNRHPQEWATIKEARERAEREEMRAERRALLELAARNAVPARRGKAVAGDDDQTAA